MKRRFPWRAFAAFFLALLAANARHLADPPYWDAVLGVYHQGAWLARHGLDYAALFREPRDSAGGARVHPFYLLAAVFAALSRALPPKAVFLVLHASVLACGAAGLAAFHDVLREIVPDAQALLWIAAAASGPIFAAQTASIYLEIPLAGLLALSARDVRRGRWRAAAAWSIAAYFVKSAALLQAVALFVCGAALLAEALGESAAERPGTAWLLLPMPAMIALNRLAGAGPAPDPPSLADLPRNAARLAAQTPYLFPALLCQLAVIPAGLAAAGRAGRRALSQDAATARWLALLALWTGGFWVSFLLVQRNLARYTVFVHLPAACLAAAAWRTRPRWSAALAAAFIAWNLANLHGAALRPLPAAIGRSGDRLERSREYLDDLRADQELAGLLTGPYAQEPVVVRWPFPHILRFPELGYVTAPRARVIDATRPFLRGETEPVSLALAGRRTLCVYAPNVFEMGLPRLAPRAGDEILWTDARLPAPLVLFRRTWTASDLGAAP